MLPLILASASPQRTRLLEQAGIAHTVRVAECHEDLDRDESAEAMVERICRTKLAAVLEQFPRELVATHRILCADTLVSYEHHRLGKPADRAEAAAFLRLLSGRSHQVLTGMALWTPQHEADGPGMRRAARAGAADAARDPGASPAPAGTAGGPPNGTIDYAVSVSDVRFAPLMEADVNWYLDSCEWEGAAGGYRIQGRAACLIEEIRGSWTGIVGLPLELAYRLLVQDGNSVA